MTDREELLTEAIGQNEGDRCNRTTGTEPPCPGVIELLPDNTEGGCCSCHIAPPCGYCTSTIPECPVCGWRDE